MEDLVFLQGISATKQTLRKWNENPWKVIGVWAAWSLLVACGLLAAVFAVAHYSQPDPTGIRIPGFNRPADIEDIGFILFRNSLVLALHGFACVAGFIALNSLPYSAAHKSGISRIVHEKAGPFAMLFVAGATLFSLATQAYFIGGVLSTAAAQLSVSNLHLLVLLLPHALLELTALFLPLAAWLVASRRGDWDQLLAATLVTVGIAVPALILSVSIEVYVFPELIRLTQ